MFLGLVIPAWGVYPLVYSLLIRLIAWVQQAILSLTFFAIVLFAQDAFANLGQNADFHLCQFADAVLGGGGWFL